MLRQIKQFNIIALLVMLVFMSIAPARNALADNTGGRIMGFNTNNALDRNAGHYGTHNETYIYTLYKKKEMLDAGNGEDWDSTLCFSRSEHSSSKEIDEEGKKTGDTYYGADGPNTCEARGIYADDYKVMVNYYPIQDLRATSAPLILMMASMGPGGAILGTGVALAARALVIWAAAMPPQSFTIPVGGSYHNPNETWVTTFTAVREGDKACVYAHVMGVLDFKVPRYEYRDNNDAFKALTEEEKKNIHCVTMPPYPYSLTPPDWGDMISETCTNYDNSATNFRYDDGSGRAFTGVVVQCIEETINNLFYNENGEGETLFTSVQEKLKQFVLVLMVLYVIFIGYTFIIEKRGAKQSEFIWMGLKISLVFYFAVGSGMSDFLSGFQNLSRDMSQIVMDASLGNSLQSKSDPFSETVTIEEAKSKAVSTKEDLDIAAEDLAIARRQWAIAKQGGSDGVSEYEVVEAKDEIYQQAQKDYNSATALANSFGKGYCDFSGFDYVDEETGKDMSFMRMWDTIDCKISKYMGIGDSPYSKYAPQILLIGISTLFFPFLLISISVFTACIILLIIRCVHIYIIAFMAVVILAFMAPLIIPAALFKFTKGIFDKWLSQIMSYLIQPIIMFTFLSLTLAIMDMFVYGNNYKFTGMTSNHEAGENMMCMYLKDANGEVETEICNPGHVNKILKYRAGLLSVSEDDPTPNMVAGYDLDRVNFVCMDEDAPACIYNKVLISFQTFFAGIDFAVNHNMNFSMYWILFWGMIKLLVVVGIAFVIMGRVEELSATLTNAAGSAASMTSTPKSSPGNMLIAQGKLAKGGFNVAWKGARAGLNTIGAVTGTKPAMEAARRGGVSAARAAPGAPRAAFNKIKKMQHDRVAKKADDAHKKMVDSNRATDTLRAHQAMKGKADAKDDKNYADNKRDNTPGRADMLGQIRNNNKKDDE